MNPKLEPTFAVTRKVALRAAAQMDWEMAAGIPCFHVMESGKFCGHGRLWIGHEVKNAHHEFVSLADLVRGITD